MGTGNLGERNLYIHDASIFTFAYTDIFFRKAEGWTGFSKTCQDCSELCTAFSLKVLSLIGFGHHDAMFTSVCQSFQINSHHNNLYILRSYLTLVTKETRILQPDWTIRVRIAQTGGSLWANILPPVWAIRTILNHLTMEY